MKRKLTEYEKGVRTFFDKRYMWLLDENGHLGLYGLHHGHEIKEQDEQ